MSVSSPILRTRVRNSHLNLRVLTLFLLGNRASQLCSVMGGNSIRFNKCRKQKPAAPRDGNGRKLGALSMYLCDDHRLARHWGEPTRQKGCYPGVQHRPPSWSTVLYQFAARHVSSSKVEEICDSRNIGLAANYTEDRTLHSHHFVWSSLVTPRGVRILKQWNPAIRCRVHKGTVLITALRKANPAHSLPPFLISFLLN
jgi:hypothetical protein